jgi:hypothetical protein
VALCEAPHLGFKNPFADPRRDIVARIRRLRIPTDDQFLLMDCARRSEDPNPKLGYVRRERRSRQ